MPSIGPLTHYVLDAALRQCRGWRQAGHEFSMAVNVSARRLLDLEFPEEVAGLLARWQVPARLLVVEITESAIMADPASALEVLGQLNQMGMQLSTWDQLDALGCDAIQGSYVSRPVPPDDLVSWLEQQTAMPRQP